MTSSEIRLQWFGGNTDALNMFNALVDLAHVWDDLVDGDKPVNESDINRAFLTALVYLPANPFYQSIQLQILPLWLMVVSAYDVANKFEKLKDEHGLEISHNLRYAAGHIVIFMSQTCVGYERAKEFMPDIWKDIVNDRIDDYRREHLNAKD
jgi:hypothetical protein